ncbi:UNVERIFIED_ORG: hypothetical protein E4P37_20310 [Bacillus sp. AZ43]
MSSPSPTDPLLVRPDDLTGLAGELTALAAELSEDADLCRAAAGSLSSALGGDEGWTAGAAAVAWAGLDELLAARTAALARAITGAVQAYVGHDTGLAGALEGPR